MYSISNKKGAPFIINEEKVREILGSMERDKNYTTEISYSANAVLYPDHAMSFTDKHLAYLKSHPSLNPEHYIANLKLKTKNRS